MTEVPNLGSKPREHWGSKAGVVLAVAGSAVGLGNVLLLTAVLNYWNLLGYQLG